MNRKYDYIIIGSGFGGSVSALRLAEKGYQVTDAEGLWKALTEAVAKDEPAVVEVKLVPGSEVSPWPFILRDAFGSK